MIFVYSYMIMQREVFVNIKRRFCAKAIDYLCGRGYYYIIRDGKEE